jgi:diguanylate cyclase (GGDEF)-like protein
VRLPPELLLRYRAERNSRDSGRLLLTVLVGVAFFDGFLFSDGELIPDVAELSAWTRVAVITPLGLLYIPLARWVLRRDPATRLHHAYASAVGVTMVAWVCALQLATESSTGVTYFLGAFLVVTYFFSAVRTSLEVATVTLVSSGAIFLAAMSRESVMVAPIRLDAAMTMVVFVVFGLLVTHRDEQTSRRLFVSALRTQELVARREFRLAQLATLNETLARDAGIDALTGVPNRRALDAAVHSWREEGAGQRAVLVVDLDQFKDYNDGLGHAAGDRCLQRVAEAMAACLRQMDALLTRYGGEEFVVLLDAVRLDQAVDVAERLRGAVEQLAIRAPAGGSVTVSIGGAWSPRLGLVGVNDLMESADEALYAAKAAGRNAVVFSASGHPAAAAPVAG